MSAALMKSLPYLLELAGAGFLISAFAFISWTKVALGAALLAIGAFFPHSTSDKASGSGALKLGGITVTLRGSLRVGVVLGGLALIISEGLDTAQKTKKYRSATEESASVMSDLFGSSSERAGTFASLTSQQRIEKLSEVQATLEYMQSVKPDPQIAKVLASVEVNLQLEVVKEQLEKRSGNRD